MFWNVTYRLRGWGLGVRVPTCDPFFILVRASAHYTPNYPPPPHRPSHIHTHSQSRSDVPGQQYHVSIRVLAVKTYVSCTSKQQYLCHNLPIHRHCALFYVYLFIYLFIYLFCFKLLIVFFLSNYLGTGSPKIVMDQGLPRKNYMIRSPPIDKTFYMRLSSLCNLRLLKNFAHWKNH